MKQSEVIFRSKMTLDFFAKFATYLLVYGVGIGVPTLLGLLYALLFNNLLFLLLPALFMLIFFLTWFFSPKAVSLSQRQLQIERPLGPIVIPLSELASVRKIGTNLGKEAGFFLRLWGSGGAWGTFGYFWSKKWGTFKIHATNSKIVLLQLKNGKRIVISPDNQDEFVQKINKYL